MSKTDFVADLLYWSSVALTPEDLRWQIWAPICKTVWIRERTLGYDCVEHDAWVLCQSWDQGQSLYPNTNVDPKMTTLLFSTYRRRRQSKKLMLWVRVKQCLIYWIIKCTLGPTRSSTALVGCFHYLVIHKMLYSIRHLMNVVEVQLFQCIHFNLFTFILQFHFQFIYKHITISYSLHLVGF